MDRRQRNRQLVYAVALLFIGLTGLLGMGGSLSHYRSVDVLRMLASGACFGAALVSILVYFRGGAAPRSG
ncbi:MAG TPA: hypothetical protein VIA45_16680 [Thermoanaerobaculia bacterium]|jgi:hypothetical protein